MRLFLAFFLMLVVAASTLAQPAPPVLAEIVIRGATLFDGTGNPGVKGDLAIRGDRIVAVGEFTVANRARSIDGTGLYLAPGFIDLHTHCDTGSPGITQEKGRKNRCYLWQGVTTIVTGNCGSGPVDVRVFYNILDNNGVGTNVAHQMPHNSIRDQVMGNSDRPPTDSELRTMRNLVDRGMRDGAWGLSTGLIYNPGTYAKTEEIIALAQVAARYNGFYASHIRNESTGLLTAVEEALRIGKEANLPVHISHFKSSGRSAWGLCADAIALVEHARAEGQPVTADQYPYYASSTSLTATLVPTRYREGSHEEYRQRLDDAELGPRIREAVEEALGDDGGERILIAHYRPRPEWNGLRLGQIAEQEGKSVLDTALDIERGGGAQIVHFSMREEDIRLIMQQDFVATASDGASQIPGDTKPHPRSYGCFPRKIGRYAIADQVISVEQAIRSASGLPADILRISDRGYLKPGYYADVVLFDPETFRDQATFEEPHQLSTGIRYLFVNGKAVIADGQEQDILPGRALRKR